MESFSVLPDPRRHVGKVRYKLLDVVVMAVCAVIAGADNWIEVERFARAKRKWFSQFLDTSEGAPSHDTFARVFSMIDVDRFADCFIDWAASLADLVDGRIVAIDGKTLRRSHDGDPSSALHMLSAFCTSSGLVLGQCATDAKSNEITAIPELLDLLALNGAIVTIDAMGCQKSITSKITTSGGDYVIALKKNQPKLHDGVAELFAGLGAGTPKGTEACSFYETQERSRDRHEVRSYFATDKIQGISAADGWAGLRSAAMVVRRVTRGDWVTTEIAYFVSSLEADAEQIAKAVRSHWRIENSLHWVLDVVFREDDSRVRRDNSAHGLAVLRHIALNLIRQDDAKDSLKGKRQRAAWDEDYLAKLVFKG